MHNRSIAWLGVLGVTILAVPLLWNTGNKSSNTAEQRMQSDMKIKQNIVQQDVDVTGKLFALDVRKDLEQAVATLHQASPSEAQQKVRQLMQLHPQFVYVAWLNEKEVRQWSYGELPKDEMWQTNKQLNSFVQSAKLHISKRESYVSPELLIRGERHIVMGIPASNANVGLVAVINRHVVQSVRSHQQKNLRLVPYPPDSKYRVKSVDSNTMQDVPVRTGADNEGKSHYYQKEIVVRFRTDPDRNQMQQIMRETGCSAPRKLGNTYLFRSNWMSAEQMQQYFAQFNPLYAEPHYLYMTNEEKTSLRVLSPTSKTKAAQAGEEPNDLFYKNYQWNLPIIHTNGGWNLTKGKQNVVVAVVDTGVDLKHADLKNKLVKGYNVFDPDKLPQDDVGHGTHVAGIIGATVNNGEGVAGMTWYNPIMPIKALDSNGSGTSYSVAEGIIWATDHGAKVINLSLGNYADGAFLHDAVKYAFERDVVLIAATGNDNTRRPGFPAAYPEVFAVSATDENKQKASFSNYGSYVDVVAPGATIASTYPNNQYAALSGTSMACPHVSALAALIRSANPSLRNTEIYDIMRESVNDLGSPGKDTFFGFGQIDVERALNMADQRKTSLSLHPQNVESNLNRIVSRFVRQSAK
ncbi:S8 family peptidase [Paenibacillus sp. 481]|uniref:S8 family peptidase n=1 Tax=Paenibacillus sp. 481 TaxID=2835869 RepID=UPI001E5D4464|nr:S8 family peptidase [Paenibacillus sp. 481]UHA74154.1 peptidase S8 [Paenibacillus sp. 481]